MTQTPIPSPYPDSVSIDQAVREYPKNLFRDPSICLEEDADLLLAVAFTPDPDFNFLYGGYVGPDAKERLAAPLSRLRAWNVPFQWLIPSTAAECSAALVAQGVPKVGDAPIMTLDLAQLNPVDAQVDGLTLHRVVTEADLHAWMAVAVEVFGFKDETARRLMSMGRAVVFDANSPVSFYLGRVNGEVVGTALNMHGEALVSVWAVGTVERARGRGIGAAMTTGPLLEAREAGYKTAMLLSTPAGFPVYSRLGWEVRATCPVHIGSPAQEGD